MNEEQYFTAYQARQLVEALNGDSDDWSYRLEPSAPNVVPTYGMYRIRVFDENDEFVGYF